MTGQNSAHPQTSMIVYLLKKIESHLSNGNLCLNSLMNDRFLLINLQQELYLHLISDQSWYSVQKAVGDQGHGGLSTPK